MISTLMGFLGAGTRVSSLLKIAEEAGCQVFFLPCLLFKGPCEIFIKINEDRQPAASPVLVRVQRTVCAVPVSLAEGMGFPGAATARSGGMEGQGLSVSSVFPGRGSLLFVLKDSRGGRTKAVGYCCVQSPPGWQSLGFSAASG